MKSPPKIYFRRLRFIIQKAAKLPPKMVHVCGSGTVTIVKPQLTKVDWPPPERSAMKSVQTPFGLEPSRLAKVLPVGARLKTLGEENGLLVRLSGAQTPVS